MGIPDRWSFLHVDEIRAAYHRHEEGLRRRAVPVAHGAHPHTGTALALLARVYGSPSDIAPGILIELHRIRQADNRDLGLRSFHISAKIQELGPPVN